MLYTHHSQLQPAIASNDTYHISSDDQQTVIVFLNMLYEQSGYIQLGYAKEHPKLGLTHEWHSYSPDSVERIANRAVALARRYGDVYCSVSRYGQRKRAKDFVLPSTVIFVDDVCPDVLPVLPSILVETSNQNYQVLYRLDTALDVASRETLARRIAYITNADKSGYDATQIIRLPIGFNTKHSPAFPVRLVINDATLHYSTATLDLAFPSQPEQAIASDSLPIQPIASDLASRAAEIPLARLLDRDGLPRRWNTKRRSEYHRLVLEVDSSRLRYWLAKSLRLHGYPAHEAYAIMDHLTLGTSVTRRKSARWYHDDIIRCLTKIWLEYPNVHEHPTPINFKIKSNQPQPARSVGRPNGITADQLYKLYSHLAQAEGQYIATKAECAKLAKVSIRTISNLEYELKQQGKLERQSHGRLSWVLLKDAKTTHAKIPETAPQMDAKKTNFCMGNDQSFSPIESIESAVSKIEHIVNGEHTPLENPPTAQAVYNPSLRLGACVSPESDQQSTGAAEQDAPKQSPDLSDWLNTLRPAAELHTATVAPLDPALIAKLPKATADSVLIRPFRRSVNAVTSSSPPPAAQAALMPAIPTQLTATDTQQPTTARQLIGARRIPDDLDALESERRRLIRGVYGLPKAEQGKVWAVIKALQNRIAYVAEDLGIDLNERRTKKPKGTRRTSKQAALEEMRA